MYTDLTTLCVKLDDTLRQALAHMDQSHLGIVLVVSAKRRLLGTITDGDVRRSLLAHMDLDQSVGTLLAHKAGTRYAQPITAPMGADRNTCLNLFKAHNILHLPLVDEEWRVAALVTLDEFLPDEPLSLSAVVMAGGAGNRLSPLTEETPKPMLRIGDRPLLEIIIRQLGEAGIKRVTVTLHHKPEKIEEHFGDGKDFGVNLSYAMEDRPLGTIGGLGLLEVPTETTLVMNGDILTQVDFRAMLIYHREHQADLTIGVRHHCLKVPYGVVECEGPVVRKIKEKPNINLFVNAGIYLLEPSVYRYIPSGRHFDMTDLIERLIAEGRSVVSFLVRESWLDIGQYADYERAQVQVKDWVDKQ